MDRLNQQCEHCKEGVYQELSVLDGVYGFLHCNKCGKRVRWHEDDIPVALPVASITSFMSRAFICDNCGRRNYYDIVQMDPEYTAKSIQNLGKEVLEEFKKLKQRNQRQALELVAFVEPLTITCTHCGTTYSPV